MRPALRQAPPTLRPATERARPWLIAVVATLAMSVSYLDRQTLAAIAPTVREKLLISHEQFGWLTSAFAIAYLACAPVSGWLVDRVGARRALAFAVLLWSAVAAAHGLASSFVALVVLRVALGVAEAPSFPAAAQTISVTLPPSQRSAGFGMLFTGSSIGAMVAAPLAVRIAADYDFRYAFLGTALAGLLWLPAWLTVTANAMPKREPPVPERASRPALGPLLRHPAMLRQAVVVATSAPALMLVMNWYPQYLTEASGVPKDDVGHYLWLPPLMFDVAAVVFGVVASARDRRRSGASHWGLMLVAASLTATLALAPLAPGPWSRVLLAGASMAGGGGMYVLGTADMMRRVPAELVATAGGLSAAVQSVMQITVSPVLGRILDRSHAWSGALVLLGALAIPGALAFAWLPSERPRAT